MAKTSTERSRKFRDKSFSIDKELYEAYNKIDWNRRKHAEKDIVTWVNQYCVGLTLDESPSQLGSVVLQKMGQALNSHQKFGIAMGRGEGKSCLSICASLYAMFTGQQKFLVIVAANARSSNAILNDFFRAFQGPDSKLANDYPEIILPFILSNGSFKRRQTFANCSTDIRKTMDRLVFPTYNVKGFQRASGSVICCRSITGGIRGLRHHTQRPTAVILDDIQTSESAHNPDQVQKLLDIINSDLIPLAGKERLSILNCFTQICPDDLVDKLKADKSWNITIYPSVISFPTNLELWKTYLDMYEDETASQASHDESLKFYIDHQYQMDDGSQCFNPHRYSKADGYISAIQKFMLLRREMGEQHFDAEYQQSPHSLKFSLPISPTLVASRISPYGELEVPKENVVAIYASTDLNLSKYLTTTICLFMRDQTVHVIYHKFRKCSVPANIPENDYYQRVYDLLGQHGQELYALCHEHGIKLDGWAIDQNGLPWKAVCDFCHNSKRVCGIQACGFVGTASHMYRSFLRSRLKEDVNRTLLCGDDDEKKVSGSGRKWQYFDSDFYHEKVQKGFLQQVGNIGSIMWYKGSHHEKWATQVCAEKLIQKRMRQDGTWEYAWKQIGNDHDALDSIGQCLAAYASQGYSIGELGGRPQMLKKNRKRVGPTYRYKFV